jgi:hypothetical protein
MNPESYITLDNGALDEYNTPRAFVNIAQPSYHPR